MAAIGSNAPIVPGLTKLPAAGQYYASTALANLIKLVPRNELADRFPGHEIGVIGQKGLSFPTELTIVIGYTPSQLQSLPGTITVNNIANAPQLQGTTNIYRIAFGIGAIAILFPILILINTASRLATARREQRYAALRLVGATRKQLSSLASVDASLSGLFGALLGTGLFLSLRSSIASISFSGVKFFPNTVTPTLTGYLFMLIGVPLLATFSSLISLYRVQISPLGVSRRTTPPPPRVWRLIPLAIGIPVFLTASFALSNKAGTTQGSPKLVFLGFILILVGLVLGGSWLTMWLARMLGRFAAKASTLLASRRLADNPKQAYRSISGLVLAVFVGSVIAVLIPTINAAQSPISSASLTNILRMNYSFPAQTGGAPPESGGEVHIKGFQGPQMAPSVFGLSPTSGAQLVSSIENIQGSQVIPLYNNSSYQNVLSCVSLEQLPVLGSCKPGYTYVVGSNVPNLLFTDNPLFVNKALPIVTESSLGTTSNLSGLYTEALLIKTKNAYALERVRTYLTNYDLNLQEGGGQNLTGWQMGDLEPETFGEVAKIRNNDDTNAERIVLAAVGITILVAGCSLAVSVGGSLVERKRPFTLLRLSGSPIGVLYKVIVLEAALPLIAASLIAAGLGIGVSIPVINALLKNLAPAAKYAAHPGAVYYLMMAGGLVISLLLISFTLPLLKRLTRPEEARFE